MTVPPQCRIPKVIIGNPEVEHLAYDFIPNYCPRLVAGAAIVGTELHWHSHIVPLDPTYAAILSRCDGHTPLSTIIADLTAITGKNAQTSGRYVMHRLKEARCIDLVKRDNQLTHQGLFIRIRDREVGATVRRWLFLPPFSQRVLALCSGAFSIREMTEILQREHACQPQGIVPSAATLQAALLHICTYFVQEQLIAWIDDEHQRDARRMLFLQNPTIELQLP